MDHFEELEDKLLNIFEEDVSEEPEEKPEEEPKTPKQEYYDLLKKISTDARIKHAPKPKKKTKKAKKKSGKKVTKAKKKVINTATKKILQEYGADNVIVALYQMTKERQEEELRKYAITSGLPAANVVRKELEDLEEFIERSKQREAKPDPGEAAAKSAETGVDPMLGKVKQKKESFYEKWDSEVSNTVFREIAAAKTAAGEDVFPHSRYTWEKEDAILRRHYMMTKSELHENQKNQELHPDQILELQKESYGAIGYTAMSHTMVVPSAKRNPLGALPGEKREKLTNDALKKVGASKNALLNKIEGLTDLMGAMDESTFAEIAKDAYDSVSTDDSVDGFTEEDDIDDDGDDAIDDNFMWGADESIESDEGWGRVSDVDDDEPEVESEKDEDKNESKKDKEDREKAVFTSNTIEKLLKSNLVYIQDEMAKLEDIINGKQDWSDLREIKILERSMAALESALKSILKSAVDMGEDWAEKHISEFTRKARGGIETGEGTDEETDEEKPVRNTGKVIFHPKTEFFFRMLGEANPNVDSNDMEACVEEAWRIYQGLYRPHINPMTNNLWWEDDGHQEGTILLPNKRKRYSITKSLDKEEHKGFNGIPHATLMRWMDHINYVESENNVEKPIAGMTPYESASFGKDPDELKQEPESIEYIKVDSFIRNRMVGLAWTVPEIEFLLMRFASNNIWGVNADTFTDVAAAITNVFARYDTIIDPDKPKYYDWSPNKKDLGKGDNGSARQIVGATGKIKYSLMTFAKREKFMGKGSMVSLDAPTGASGEAGQGKFGDQFTKDAEKDPVVASLAAEIATTKMLSDIYGDPEKLNPLQILSFLMFGTTPFDVEHYNFKSVEDFGVEDSPERNEAIKRGDIIKVPGEDIPLIHQRNLIVKNDAYYEYARDVENDPARRHLIKPFETFYDARVTSKKGQARIGVLNSAMANYRLEKDAKEAEEKISTATALIKSAGEKVTNAGIAKKLGMSEEEFVRYKNVGKFARKVDFANEEVAGTVYKLMHRAAEMYDMINMTPMYYDAFLKEYADNIPGTRDDFSPKPRVKIHAVVRRNPKTKKYELVLRQKAQSTTIMNWITSGGLGIGTAYDPEDITEVSQTGNSMGWFTPQNMQHNLRNATFAWDAENKKPHLPHMLHMDGRDLVIKYITQTLDTAKAKSSSAGSEQVIGRTKLEVDTARNSLRRQKRDGVEPTKDQLQGLAEIEAILHEQEKDMVQIRDNETFRKLPKIMVKIEAGSILYEYADNKGLSGINSYLAGTSGPANRTKFAEQRPKPLTLDHAILKSIVAKADKRIDTATKMGRVVVEHGEDDSYQLILISKQEKYGAELDELERSVKDGHVAVRNQIETVGKSRSGRDPIKVQWVRVPEVSDKWLFRLNDIVARVPKSGILAIIRRSQDAAYTWTGADENTSNAFVTVLIKPLSDHPDIDLTRYKKRDGDARGWAESPDESDVRMVNVELDKLEFGRAWCVVHKQSMNDLKLGALAIFGKYLDENWGNLKEYADMIGNEIAKHKQPRASGGRKLYGLPNKTWLKFEHNYTTYNLGRALVIGQIMSTIVDNATPKYRIAISKEFNTGKLGTTNLQSEKYADLPPVTYSKCQITSFNQGHIVQEKDLPEGAIPAPAERAALDPDTQMAKLTAKPGDEDDDFEEPGESESLVRSQAITESIQRLENINGVFQFFIQMSKDLQQFDTYDEVTLSFDLND